MARLGILYRLPALVVVDLERNRVDSVEIPEQAWLEAWTGAAVEENGGAMLRGARPEEIGRAVRIAASSPWPAAASADGRPARLRRP